MFAGVTRHAGRGQAESRGSAGGTVADQRDVAIGVVRDGRTIRQADFGRWRRGQQYSEVPAPGVVADAQVRSHEGQGQWSRGCGRSPPIVVGLDPLPVRTRTDRKHLIHPIGYRWVDVDRLDVEFVRLRASLPRVAVLGGQAKRCVDAQTEIEILVYGPRDIGIRRETPATRIATIARDAKHSRARTAVAELENRSHGGHATRKRPARQLRHARRVVPDRAGIARLGSRAGIGVAQTAALLKKLKTGSYRATGRYRHKQCGNPPHRKPV